MILDYCGVVHFALLGLVLHTSCKSLPQPNSVSGNCDLVFKQESANTKISLLHNGLLVHCNATNAEPMRLADAVKETTLSTHYPSTVAEVATH